MVSNTEAITRPASDEAEWMEALHNPNCVCCLTEDNICESCLAPILPSGKVAGGGDGVGNIPGSISVMSAVRILSN